MVREAHANKIDNLEVGGNMEYNEYKLPEKRFIRHIYARVKFAQNAMRA